MISLLWHAVGGNKILPYVLLVLLVLAAIAAVYWQGMTKGRASVETKQLKDSLNRYIDNAKRKTEIESLSSATARERLRNKWQRR